MTNHQPIGPVDATKVPRYAGLGTFARPALPGAAGPAARAERYQHRGADVVEVAPAYDHADITTLAAATVVFDLLALMVNRDKGISALDEELEASAL